jgi:hypothetical protein
MLVLKSISISISAHMSPVSSVICCFNYFNAICDIAICDMIDMCSSQENPRSCWVFLKYSFSKISNHRIFCFAKVGKNPENLRFSWLLDMC